MRILLILRGVAGCGKSTWLKQQDLEKYTISSDTIRLMYASPILKVDGSYTITQRNDNRVWNTLYSLLEYRMINGDFTIIDATHYRESSLKDYKKLCEKYNYRMIIVDFSEIPLEVIKTQNNLREEYKKVSDEIIDKMYEVIKQPLKSKYETYSYDDKELFEKICLKPIQLEAYNKVVVFGDIHGCYEPLNEYFTNNPINDNTYYIFCGDLWDRGIQNKEVLQFCLDNCEKSNFCFIQGNHELWLKNYIRDGENAIITDEFKKSLEQFGELKSQLSKFGRRLKQCFTFEKNGKIFTFTHGGVTKVATVEVPTMQLIKGVGEYSDSEIVDETFSNDPFNQNCYSFHGHRNIYNVPIRNTEKTFNLEGKVEFGGYLRGVEIDFTEGKPMFNEIEIKNDVFNEKLIKKETNYEQNNSILKSLDISSLVRKKELSHGIVSYNFTRDAFYKKQWNEMTTTARGLFVDSDSGKIVCRSYNKFFNIEERPETQWRNLQQNLQFPVEVYLKENGFLGIVSYDYKTNDLFIASKSTNEGDYAGYFKELLLKELGNNVNKFKEFLKKMDSSAIFEVIDIVNDPHIIKYPESGVFLLDVVKNDFSNTFMDYDSLQLFAKEFNFETKVLFKTCENFESLKELIDYYDDSMSGVAIEGFVVKDSKGFMFKYKTPYYKFWKEVRKYKDWVIKGKEITNISDKIKDVIEFMKTFDVEDLEKMSIIDVREKYYEIKN